MRSTPRTAFLLVFASAALFAPAARADTAAPAPEMAAVLHVGAAGAEPTGLDTLPGDRLILDDLATLVAGETRTYYSQERRRVDVARLSDGGLTLTTEAQRFTLAAAASDAARPTRAGEGRPIVGEPVDAVEDAAGERREEGEGEAEGEREGEGEGEMVLRREMPPAFEPQPEVQGYPPGTEPMVIELHEEVGGKPLVRAVVLTIDSFES
jgi:hypothetical protein